jgi:hypothetical protein
MLAMTLLLVYAVLLLAVLLSALAHRPAGCSPFSPGRRPSGRTLGVILSIVAHSSTDVFVATQFDEEREIPGWCTA